MENIKKIKEDLNLGSLVLRRYKQSSLEGDMGNIIFENLVREGKKGIYKLNYFFSKRYLNAVLEWYVDRTGIDYHELLEINEVLDKFSKKHVEHFRDFGYNVFAFACENFADDVILELIDAKLDDYYDDEDEEYYDPNEGIE